MIELENYKSNLEVQDKYDIKRTKIDKGKVYAGRTEYINPQIKQIEHTSPLLAAAVLGLDNTGAPLPENPKFFDTWTDIDAQEIQLNTKPTCYIIFGKPGLGSFKLGEAMAAKYNVIHLCPRNMLIDEIEQKSSTGRTWEFNMRQNKVCCYDMILAMFKIKLNSEVVQHRGYVISGIPLVTCCKKHLSFINSLYGEEGFLEIDELLFETIRNLKKKKKKPPGSASSIGSNLPAQGGEEEAEEEEEEEEEKQEEENLEEEEDKPAELPKHLLDSCSDIIVNKKPRFESKLAMILNQFNELFNLTLKPDIIIHITCPELDIVKLRSHIYINYKTGLYVYKPFISNYIPEPSWPRKCRIGGYVDPLASNVFNPKYNCKAPSNYEAKVIDELCNYNNNVVPYLERKFKDFDPKMIIELDGRASTNQKLHEVSETLILMQIQPVIIPNPLFLEEAPEDLEEFWDSVGGLDVVSSGVVNFKYYASPWFNRCPIEQKLRRSMAGKPKYAVMFFKHVYLMFSLNNFITFYKNPRPYLKLKYLEPNCRVMVVGTKSSGKTMISQCLSWIFDAPLFTYNTILETEREKKYYLTSVTILSEIIATIEDARFQQWQATEVERKTNLNEWCISARALLKQYLLLLIEKTAFDKRMAEKILKKQLEKIKRRKKLQKERGEHYEEEEEEEDDKVEEIEEEFDPDMLSQLNNLETELSFLPIFLLNSIEECRTALKSQNISEYAPIELLTVTDMPQIPVIGDEDVSTAITMYIEANDLQKDLEPTPEELMTVIVKLLTEIDTKHQEDTQSEQLYGKYIMDGFPADPEYWDFLDPKLFPDYTIALIENREIDEELYQHYSSANTCSKRFDEKTLLAKDPLIHTKLQATSSTASSLQDIHFDIQKIVNHQLNDTLDLMFITENESQPHDDDANFQAQFISSFTEAIEKFRENWDSLKIKVDDNSKSYIEIELENKTDVELIDEMLHQLRQCYGPGGRELDEDEEPDDAFEDEADEASIDLLSHNDQRFLCETNIYCPIAYYDHHVLWQGKPEFSFKYDNKIHYFCKEEFVELFKNNIDKYQFYNIPYKKIPKLKICVIGSIGSGATSLSKYIAKELGLLHIDFADIINEYLVPKHFKKIGRQYENIFVDGPIEEEGVVDFQMDEENENLVSDILANEKELKRMFFEYFERGTPVLSKLMQRLLNKIWFDSNSPIGFVLDGYPKISNDVEDMMECYAIPDVVIELENDVETATERMAPIMFKSWKSQQIEAKRAATAKFNNERKLWLDFLTKEIVPKLIIEEIFENMFFLVPEPLKTDSAGSVMIDAHPSGSNLDPTLFKFYNEMVEEHPEPQDTSEWEKSDEARERIEGRIEGIFETYEEGVESIKEMLMEQRIKTVTVKATRPLNKVTRSTLSKLKNLRNRCESFFEQTFIVTIDIAEILLIRGFYFYSKFYRLCPVYIFENPQAIQNPYKTSIRKGTLFPVVHRTYIYFISSADNVIKFRTNPLKYITCDAIKTYYEYPLRIGVIGPPKSGQSSLAARLAKQYGLLCISPGSAVRNVLENLHWTELAAEMIKCLKDGNKIGEDHIVKAMQMAAIDHRTVTCGYVLDGAPLSPYRATGHAKGCLFPNIIFDISSYKSRILENSQNEIHYDILKYMPPYSYPLIQLRYEHWERKQHKIRNWIAEDYQNLFVLDGSLSQWHVLQQASDHLSVLTSKIHYYIDNVDKNIVPAIMISNETFQARQSQYKKMCPVCFHKKVYNHMGSHIRGKTGVVQYQKTFYWICDEHMDMVMAFPHRYLNAIDVEIPEMPALINIVNLDYVYENGICIVTYAENLPGQVIKIGTNLYAASYAGKSYLFCSKVCLCKFVSKPYLYKDITIFKNPKSFPKLSLKNLPNLGYLEQILGNILTEACCSVNAFRPKYPGLSFQTSALIYIGLYLKTHNPLIDNIKLPMYLKAFRIFEARCKLLLNVGLRLRSMDNPFATYPKCVHRKPTLNPADVEQEYLCSSQIQGTSENIPEKTSNYVQLHKPSYRQKLNKRSMVKSQMERD